MIPYTNYWKYFIKIGFSHQNLWWNFTNTTMAWETRGGVVTVCGGTVRSWSAAFTKIQFKIKKKSSGLSTERTNREDKPESRLHSHNQQTEWVLNNKSTKNHKNVGWIGNAQSRSLLSLRLRRGAGMSKNSPHERPQLQRKAAEAFRTPPLFLEKTVPEGATTH